jgi:RNA polymerase sigma-70 factor (ECF subfamily)
MNPREQAWADAMRAERRGDAAAYARLLREIADALRSSLRHRLAQRGLGAHETEDLVQDVLIGLHTKRHTWDERRPFLPWLHAIAHYKLVDTARRLRRAARDRIELGAGDLIALFEPPLDERDRTAPDLDGYLAALPQTQRAVVHALAIEGASVRATARRLRTTEGAVRVSFHRARQRLRKRAPRDAAPPSKGKTRCPRSV